MMQNKIFTFDDVLPPIPMEEAKDAALSIEDKNVRVKKTADRIRTKPTILHAEYNQEKQSIVINVRLPNGTPKAVVLSKDCFTFNRQSASQAPQGLIDQEMLKTVNLLMRLKGKEAPFNLEIFASQMDN